MDAYFRILTAEGRGAIAVVRVWGPGALAVVDSVFRPYRGGSLVGAGTGRLRLGRAGVGQGDEVVAMRLEGGTPTVEIQCHGGVAAVAAVVRSLEEAGAVSSGPRPFEPALAVDRIRAQAMEDLAAAPTLRAAEILLDQVQGALSRSLGILIEAARRGGRVAPVSPSLAELDLLIHRAGVGTRLLGGWTVVIAGRPNVGKSRLFNALAGFDRSIVNPRPGVTRDVVSVRTALGGWPVELRDTAGEREGEDAVERLGIGRARQERRDADLNLLVLDRSVPLQDVDRDLLATMTSKLVVANKADLPPAWQSDEIEREGRAVYPVSAESGDGLDALLAAIESRLVQESPAPGGAYPFRREHVESLEQARLCLSGGDHEGFVRVIGEMLGTEQTPMRPSASAE